VSCATAGRRPPACREQSRSLPKNSGKVARRNYREMHTVRSLDTPGFAVGRLTLHPIVLERSCVDESDTLLMSAWSILIEYLCLFMYGSTG
jgi:hypothetical protein